MTVDFSFFNDKLDFNSARELCLSEGMFLAKITTRRDFEVVQTNLKTVTAFIGEGCWVGISRKTTGAFPSSFAFINGGNVAENEFAFDVQRGEFPWANSEPNSLSEEGCVEISSQQGLLYNDVACDIRRSVLCSLVQDFISEAPTFTITLAPTSPSPTSSITQAPSELVEEIPEDLEEPGVLPTSLFLVTSAILFALFGIVTMLLYVKKKKQENWEKEINMMRTYDVSHIATAGKNTKH